MSDNWRPTWLTNWSPVILGALFVALALCAGCAGTKAANVAGTHELSELYKHYISLGYDINKIRTEGDNFKEDNYKECGRRIDRLKELQECRNNTEGMATDVPMNDDALIIAKTRLKTQRAYLRMAWGVADAVGGGIFGNYWKEIIAGLVTMGVTYVGAKKVKTYKQAAKNSALGIDAIGEQFPEAALYAKDTVRRAECVGTPLDKIVHDRARDNRW